MTLLTSKSVHVDPSILFCVILTTKQAVALLYGIRSKYIYDIIDTKLFKIACFSHDTYLIMSFLQQSMLQGYV